MMHTAIRPIDDKHGSEVRSKANAANNASNRQTQFDEGSGNGHEEKIGRAVHGRLADVPNDAVTLREVLGVAHEHGRIFKRWNGKIHITPRVEKRERNK